ELLQKLRRRFPDETERVGVEVGRLTAEGLQSDARLAEAFIRARTSRGQGPSKIRMELKGKGVTDADILLAFEEAEVDWFALASEVVLKKFGDLADQEVDIRLKARVSRFLRQRGFSYDHIASLY
ncbi:MAG: recombination regulator RecX, partial [Pseudomonadales bacterium]|nr:recombination regulator RecX [Pseudomonadales bacterium]